MLDFLRRPGDYFSNFQTNGGAGPPGHSSGGGGGGGVGGGGGNPLGAVAGILTNNPLTDAVGGAVSGVVGDGSLSRQVRTSSCAVAASDRSSAAGLRAGADHLVPPRHLVPGLHGGHHGLGPAVPGHGRARRRVRARVQRDQRPGLLGGRAAVRGTGWVAQIVKLTVVQSRYLL